MFLGLDLSLTATGVALRTDTTLVFHTAPKGKFSGPVRLAWFRAEVLRLLKAYGVTHAAIEGYSFSSQHSQAHKTGELGGVIRLLLWEEGVPFIIVPPNNLKLFATGKGNCDKTLVARHAFTRWAIDAQTNDEADAGVLSVMAQAHFAGDLDLTDFQRKAMNGVEMWTPRRPPTQIEIIGSEAKPPVRTRTR